MKIIMWFVYAIVVSASVHGQTPCPFNLLRNGDFTDGKMIGNGSMPPSTVTWWEAAFRDPQYVSGDGCMTPGYMAMWGNNGVGEGIRQTLAQPLKAGTKYRLSGCQRYSNPNANKHVRFFLRFSHGNLASYSGTPSAGYTVATTNTNWTMFELSTGAAEEYDTVTITPGNNQNADDGAKVSWGNIDDLCLQECSITEPVSFGGLGQALEKLAACKVKRCPRVSEMVAVPAFGPSHHYPTFWNPPGGPPSTFDQPALDQIVSAAQKYAAGGGPACSSGGTKVPVRYEFAPWKTAEGSWGVGVRVTYACCLN